MGQAHRLVNNCLGCGRVVCEVEGEGPCGFCGNPVLRPENMDQQAEAERLMKEWETDASLSHTYFVAVEHKARLIRQDKEQGQSKNVVDEDTDWYEVKGDVWQSDTVRKQALDMMLRQDAEEQYARENVTSSINFNTGVIEDKKIVVDRAKQKALVAEMLREDKQGQEIEDRMMKLQQDKRLREKDVEVLDSIRDVYKDKIKKAEEKKADDKHGFGIKLAKKVENDDCYQEFIGAIQAKSEQKTEIGEDKFDKAFYRLGRDDNKCLSMYQPWASLLVYGFKRFEGRHWDTNYRGPLWIHAGAKEPDEATIKSVEGQYRKLYEGVDMPPLPQSYPTGCVIGVVDLQDVIDQKQYTEVVPKRYTGESTSEFLFVVRNPRRLMVNIRCPGSKGIFEINDGMVTNAINTLKRISTSWFPYYADSLSSSKATTENSASMAKQQHATLTKASSKSSSLVEAFTNTRIFKLGPDLDAKLEEFIKAFEKANFKKIEKGESGLFDNSIDQYLPGHEALRAGLAQLLAEVFEVSAATAEVSVPNKVDFYAVTKNTRKFDMRKMPYSILITMGKKAEIQFDGTSNSLMGGSAIMPTTISGSVGQLAFVKVPKTAANAGLSMIGETSLIAFH